jgi:hypothetical protein
VRRENRRAVSPWTFVLITLAAGAGVAAIPFLVALAARVVDPDVDWGEPALLMAILLGAFVFFLAPVVALLAMLGARTIAGYLAAAEVIAAVALAYLLAFLRLR